MDTMDGHFFQTWRFFFQNYHTDFFLIPFQFQDQLNTTLSQEDQQAPAQTYTPSRIIKLQHSRYGGFQGNCLGTDNKLGEDVVLLNVKN